MTTYLTFAVLGLGSGALYAALAQGLILAHRGAGVVNIGHGAMAMYIAYFYQSLRGGHILVPPLPNPLALLEGVCQWLGFRVDLPSWPTFIEVSDSLGFLPSFLLAMVMSCVLGALIHFLIFRPLRAAPPLAKTVASVGLALTIQAIVLLRFGSDTISVAPILPEDTVDFLGTRVPVDRFIMLGLTVAVALALMATFRFTRIGIATRAAAENERAAMFIGLSPNRLAAFNWVVSSLVAGAVGILFSSITGLNPTDFVLFVVPALGAALLARFTSFITAAVGGILIGVLQSLVLPLQSDFGWIPSAGTPASVPLIVIAIAIIVRGKSLPGRAAPVELKLPDCTQPRHPLTAMAILAPLVVAGLVFLPYDFRGGLVNSLAGVVLALSFVVVVGMAGQISLMQMAIAGLAALAMTRLAGDWGIPFPLSPLIAVLFAAVVGVALGLPALRVRGVQLAVLTLGAGFTFEQMILGNVDILRTSDNSDGIPPPHLFGVDFGVNASFPFGASSSPSAWFGIFELIVVLLCCGGVIWLRQSDLGLKFLALRANERAAAALGVNISRTKLAAFAIAALFAGMSGVLNGYRFGGVTPSQYVAMTSVSALALVYIGGVSRVSGALVAGGLVAGGLVTVIVNHLLHVGQFQPLLEGVGLVIAAVRHPEGIAGAGQGLYASIAAKVTARSNRPTGPAAVTHDDSDELPTTEVEVAAGRLPLGAE